MDNKHILIFMAGVVVLMIGVAGIAYALMEANSNIASLEDTISTMQIELDELRPQIPALQSELDTTKSQLDSANETIANLETTLSNTQEQLEETEEQLEETEEQLEKAQDVLGGVYITIQKTEQCKDANLVDNPSAADPTWDQLLTFLANDKTELTPYRYYSPDSPYNYDCSEFSRDLHNNAEKMGIRAGVVHIYFMDSPDTGHAINVFLTKDYGLVYIDCTGTYSYNPDPPDTIAYVKRGKRYIAIDVNEIKVGNIRNYDFWNSIRFTSAYYYIPHKVSKVTIFL